jgi:hypothetical protein
MKIGSFIILKYNIRFQNTVLCSFKKDSLKTIFSPFYSTMFIYSLYSVIGESNWILTPSLPFKYSVLYSEYTVNQGTKLPLQIGHLTVYELRFLVKPERSSSSLRDFSH